MEAIITSYVFCLLDTVVMSLALYKINPEKMRSKYLLVLSPLLLSILLSLTDFWIQFNVFNVIADYLIILVLISCIIKEKLSQILYHVFSIFITLSILDMLITFVVISSLRISLEVAINNLLIHIIAWTLSRGFFLYVFPKINFYFLNLNILKGKSKYSLMIFFLFDLIFILFCYALFSYYFVLDVSYFIVVILISMIVFNVLLNNLLKKINDFAHQDMEWKQKEQIYQLRLKNIEQEFQYIDQFHREKHDFKQHLQMILAYLSIQKVVEAKDYIYKLTDKIENLDQLNNSRYPEIASFILYKTNVSKNKGIDIQQEIQLPKTLFIEIIDLTIILGNLFDNAIEANELNSSEQKKIILRITEKNNYLIIYTENPYQRIKITDDQLQTTKSDKENHGIGLKNIHFIVDKYNGFVDMDTSAGIFSIKIALQNLSNQSSVATT